jgi:hypothetical protein
MPEAVTPPPENCDEDDFVGACVADPLEVLASNTTVGMAWLAWLPAQAVSVASIKSSESTFNFIVTFLT